MGKAENTAGIQLFTLRAPQESARSYCEGRAGGRGLHPTVFTAGFRHKHDGGEFCSPPRSSWPLAVLCGDTDAHWLPEALILPLPATPKLDTRPNGHSPPSNAKVVQHCA